MRIYFDRKSITISGRNLPNIFLGENPQTVYTSVAAKVVCHEVFYCVSGIINYVSSVSRFSKRVVKIYYLCSSQLRDLSYSSNGKLPWCWRAEVCLQYGVYLLREGFLQTTAGNIFQPFAVGKPTKNL